MTKKSLVKNFNGREKELQFLDNLYRQSAKQAQLLIISGKIRVGKTELIKKFLDRKPHIYYLAGESSSQDQLQTAVEIFTKAFEDTYLDKNALPTWRKFFDYVGSRLKSQREPIVIVFDEFPNLAESDDLIGSHFQYGWDEVLRETKVLLILVGSSIFKMNKYVLNHTSPLSRRKTAQLLVDNFSFAEVKNSLVAKNFESIFSLYALVGGVPAYIKELDARQSLKENIQKKILDRSSFLSVEPHLLLADEFSQPRVYLTILKAIGTGDVKYADLMAKTGLANNKLSIYLKNLINLNLVKREVSMTILHPDLSKKGLYSIADWYLRFYFSFVFPNLSTIESEDFETLFVENQGVIDQILQKTYREFALELLQNMDLTKVLPQYTKYGRWWNGSEEISVVATNESRQSILFLDTVWQKKPIGLEFFLNLKRKAQLVDWGGQGRLEYFALCSKSGFTEELLQFSKTENIVLIQEDGLV